MDTIILLFLAVLSVSSWCVAGLLAIQVRRTNQLIKKMQRMEVGIAERLTRIDRYTYAVYYNLIGVHTTVLSTHAIASAFPLPKMDTEDFYVPDTGQAPEWRPPA